MKIAFVYAGGRGARLDAARLRNVPIDFFYGAIEMERSGHKISVHDLQRSSSRIAGLLNRCARGLLPPKTQVSDIISAGRLLPGLRECDVVVATASGSAFALGYWKRWRRLPGHLVGIHCGTVNCRHDAARAKAAGSLLRAMTPVLFSDREACEMEEQFGVARPASLWFGVDEEYWNPDPVVLARCGVLAVGNDGRRDYQTLLAAAALLPGVPFKIVTRIPFAGSIPSNVEHIHGDWNADSLSDAALRELYRASACVVVPLHESIQPSGQSVAMQAMMCGAPVVMTRTSGWWGGTVLKPGEHIREASPGSPESLAGSIRQSLNSPPVPLAARAALLNAFWTSRGFSGRLEKICREATA